MAKERVYTVRGDQALPVQTISLAAAGLRERAHLQEWVIEHPEILGDDVTVIASEFDRWVSHDGQRQLDRLDVLGVNSDGRLVIAELKRDDAPDVVQMQAIKYAALVSRMTEDDVADAYATHLRGRGEVVTTEEALSRLELVVGSFDPDILRSPQIVLVAGDFTPTTTATVVWLAEQGLDIVLQRLQAYRTPAGEIVATVSQVFPLPNGEDLLVSPIRAQRKESDRARLGKRAQRAVSLLIDNESLEDGTPLELTIAMGSARSQIEDWVAADPRRGRARWVNDRSAPIEWEADGQRYAPSTLARLIVRESTGRETSLQGSQWWATPDGTTLASLAGIGASSGADWSLLHNVMRQLPAGRWTTYGDLATIAGTAPQPLGSHIARCPECANAHRVLGAGGVPSAGFQWTDPDRTESQRDVLEAEGLAFIDEAADPAAWMSASDLREMAGASP